MLLGFRKCNFGKGISTVLNKIEKDFTNRFAVGIVDDDKFKPRIFEKYSRKVAESDSLLQLCKPGTKHFLIVIQPAFEKWVWEQAIQCKISPPFQDFATFRRAAKDDHLHNNHQIRRFLTDIKHAESPGFVRLLTWVEGLYSKHF